MPVHPRSRGEHLAGIWSRHEVDGSSPLARGTRDPPDAGRRGCRFIPARAGNTPARAKAGGRLTVHPRSRGEHTLQGALAGTQSGSSPLARGTPLLPESHHTPSRFIPARAGNTTRRSGARGRTPVHPRSRGEHLASVVEGINAIGSSPLARGTPRSSTGRKSYERFIPARAGNTPTRAGRTTYPTVHPRSRGEHISCAATRW